MHGGGWIAQWLEMRRDPEFRIARPRQIYVAPTSGPTSRSRSAAEPDRRPQGGPPPPPITIDFVVVPFPLVTVHVTVTVWEFKQVRVARLGFVVAPVVIVALDHENV